MFVLKNVEFESNEECGGKCKEWNKKVGKESTNK